MIRFAPPDRAEALAALHAEAFASPWTDGAIRALLEQGAIGLEHPEGGFLLLRAAGDEAEILTIAVSRAARRRGLGAKLLADAAEAAAGMGCARLFLEVAVDNVPALALYARAGFHTVGRRRSYYARPGGAVDALVLSLRLPTRSGSEPSP